MNRRGFLNLIVSAPIIKHFDLRTERDHLPLTMETSEVSAYLLDERRRVVASLTMPTFDSIDQAMRVLGEDEVLKLLDRSWRVECQMYARKILRSEEK